MKDILKAEITIPKEEADNIRRLMTKQGDGSFNASHAISYTAKFPNNIEMDIKCVGVDYEEDSDNMAYAEAVLFENGHEISHSQPEDSFFGEWNIAYDGILYVVYVKEYQTAKK